MEKITFYYVNVDLKIKQKRKLKSFLKSIFAKENFLLNNLSYIFCDDSFLYNLNYTFLKHDFYTDILTFLLSKKNNPINAEIYISVERVKENSEFLNMDFREELFRTMIHGILHLCDYNDLTNKERKIIRQKENLYLKSFT